MSLPITRLWHSGDVVLGVMGVKEKPSVLNILRLGFALVGLAGNIVIERSQLQQDVIEIGGVKWKRLP